MASATEFIGGPLDGELRQLEDEPWRLFFPEAPSVARMIREPLAPVELVDHVYEKRAAGAFYEHVGTRTRVIG